MGEQNRLVRLECQDALLAARDLVRQADVRVGERGGGEDVVMMMMMMG
jgi:hypothetical protein